MNDRELIEWLLQGDTSIKYQTQRDLLDKEAPELREKITSQGWGNKFLSKRKRNGRWTERFYQPKWISSHYTLLDLRNLCISPNNDLIRESVSIIAQEEKAEDGGINPAREIKNSDVCVNGMFLNYAAYFQLEEELLTSVIDFILSQKMEDGGFNCRSNRSGAVHSSLHSTISILEGITEYEKNNYTYRLSELREAEKSAKEFILLHQLFLSDRTGEIIKKDFLRFPFPCRWKYDILRALDYFQYSNTEWDDRMLPAINILLKKRNKNKTWNVQAKYPGKIHFEMEKAGKPSRWNTLRAMRVLRKYHRNITA